MKLDLKLYDDRRMFCYERAIVSVMMYFCRNYQYMFLYTLDFTFDDNEKLLVGNRMGSGNWKCEDLLEEHHGVLLHTNTKHDTDISIFTQTIMSELKNNRPVFVEEDILITGMSESMPEFNVYKINNSTQDMVGANTLYQESGDFLTFEIVGKDISDVDIKYVIDSLWIKNSVERYTQSIKKFADCFLNCFDMKAESEDAGQFDEIPIVKNIIEVGRGRRLYKMLLEFVDQISHTQLFTDICSMLIDVENRWLMVTSKLMHAYYTGTFREKDKVLIYNQLIEIADYEDLLMERILSV